MDGIERQIRSGLRYGKTRSEIAAELGLTLLQLEQAVQATYRRARDLGVERTADRVFGDPTEDEIAERSAIERQNWSEAEHRRRAGLLPPDWTPPVVQWLGSIG